MGQGGARPKQKAPIPYQAPANEGSKQALLSPGVLLLRPGH